MENIAQKIRILLKGFPLVQSMFYFGYRVVTDTKSKLKIMRGNCALCGKSTLMMFERYNLRESGWCLFCSASTRYKVIGELVKRLIVIKTIGYQKKINPLELKNLINKLNLKKYPLKTIVKVNKSRDFKIYEPSTLGAIHNSLKKSKILISSEFFPDPHLKSGDVFKNVLFEDLQSLSFPDNYFDLVITQDVLEHVQKPFKAFGEIHRVLKPEGIHLFTVPIGNNKKTFHYFDENGKQLVQNLVYHVDPLRTEGALVFTQFGTDIVDKLNDYQFSSFFYRSDIDPRSGFLGPVRLIISIKK